MKAVLINLRAAIRRRTRRKDIEETEVNAYAQENLRCSCDRCHEREGIGSETCEVEDEPSTLACKDEKTNYLE